MSAREHAAAACKAWRVGLEWHPGKGYGSASLDELVNKACESSVDEERAACLEILHRASVSDVIDEILGDGKESEAFRRAIAAIEARGAK